MNKKVTVCSSVLAVVFALAGCLGDNIPTLYTVCMGFCFISLLVFVVNLICQEFASKKTEDVRTAVKEKRSLKRTA